MRKLRLQGKENFTPGLQPGLKPITPLLLLDPRTGLSLQDPGWGRGKPGRCRDLALPAVKIFIFRLRDWSQILPLATELFQPLPTLLV